MTPAPAPLPPEWVDRIIMRLQAHYGAEAYSDADRLAWGRGLASLSAHPSRIKDVLASLEPMPPDIEQFLALCMPPPKAATVQPKPRQAVPVGLAWAYGLKAREEAGHKLTAYLRYCWRHALKKAQAATLDDDADMIVEDRKLALTKQTEEQFKNRLQESLDNHESRVL